MILKIQSWCLIQLSNKTENRLFTKVGMTLIIGVATYLKVGVKIKQKAMFIMIYSNIFTTICITLTIIILNLYYITTKSKVTVVMPVE